MLGANQAFISAGLLSCRSLPQAFFKRVEVPTVLRITQAEQYIQTIRPKFMPRQLTDDNVDCINELIELAGCPMCPGLACVCSEAAPLGDGQRGFSISNDPDLMHTKS